MTTLNELKGKLQKLTLPQTVYPVLSAIFVILIATLFILSVQTISKLINDTVNESAAQANPFSVDQESFNVIAHKLGMSTKNEGATSTPAIEQVVPAENITPQETVSSAEATTTSSEILNPKELKIAIYNGTTIKGSAARAKTLIEQQGFSVAYTGNAKTSSRTTILQLKKSRSAYQTMLTQALGSTYAPKEVIEDIPEGGEYDVVIIVGEAQQ